MKTRALSAALLMLTLAGCKVGPNYKRPAVDVPDQYRGLAPPLPAGGAFGEMKWQSVFPDEVLQGLIKEALTNNYDIRIAASHILQAEANLGVTRSNQLPALNGSLGYRTNVRQPIPALLRSTRQACSSATSSISGDSTAGRQKPPARIFWQQKYARHLVETTLIASVATAYFQLRQLDSQLDFSQQTVVSDQDSLRINTINYKGGEYAITDVYQAKLLVSRPRPR